MKKRLIPYYRVSTARQGESGLGFEGQVEAVARYARSVDGLLLPAFQEVESGKRCDRPQLRAAIVEARRARATLVVAKLDRLTRNLAFLVNLMESRVDFVACDNPQANRLTIHILAAVAENEAMMISQRTKAALVAYKARGGLLGASLPSAHCFSGSERARGRENAARVNRGQGREFAADWQPLITPLLGRGLSYRQVAAELNNQGHLTRQGKSWTGVQVRRVRLATLGSS